MISGESRGPYWLKQWAADSSQRSPTTVAPQKCREPSFRLTCQGTSPKAAPSPPTIRVGFSSAGLAPHSAGTRLEGPGTSACWRRDHPAWQAAHHTDEEALSAHPAGYVGEEGEGKAVRALAPPASEQQTQTCSPYGTAQRAQWAELAIKGLGAERVQAAFK